MWGVVRSRFKSRIVPTAVGGYLSRVRSRIRIGGPSLGGRRSCEDRLGTGPPRGPVPVPSGENMSSLCELRGRGAISKLISVQRGRVRY